MKVNIFNREAKDGKTFLYLDYRFRRKRYRNSLELFLFSKPKTTKERLHNKETKLVAEELRYKKQRDLTLGKVNIQVKNKQQEDFVEYFKSLTKEREKSGINYDGWRSTLKHLDDYFNNGLRFSDLNKQVLENFKEYLVKGRNLKSTSSQRYFNLVKHAVHQSFRDRLIDEDYAVYVKSPKSVQSKREYLTEEELGKLFEVECDKEIIKKAFLFSSLTGIAHVDMMKLKWSDIKSTDTGYQIDFYRKKTKSLQYQPISEKAVNILGIIGNSNDRVFKGLSYSAWDNVQLKKWILRAGITKNITFHCARHTYATLLLSKKADITVIKELLGHKELRTTMIYAKIVNEDKRNAADLMNLKTC